MAEIDVKAREMAEEISDHLDMMGNGPEAIKYIQGIIAAATEQMLEKAAVEVESLEEEGDPPDLVSAYNKALTDAATVIRTMKGEIT